MRLLDSSTPKAHLAGVLSTIIAKYPNKRVKTPPPQCTCCPVVSCTDLGRSRSAQCPRVYERVAAERGKCCPKPVRRFTRRHRAGRRVHPKEAPSSGSTTMTEFVAVSCSPSWDGETFRCFVARWPSGASTCLSAAPTTIAWPIRDDHVHSRTPKVKVPHVRARPTAAAQRTTAPSLSAPIPGALHHLDRALASQACTIH